MTSIDRDPEGHGNRQNQDDDDLNLADRGMWEAFLAGYRAGIIEGILHGRTEANQEWTDVTTFACRSMRGWISREELTRRRNTTSAPSLSPGEIHAQAARSWAAVEEAIANRHGHRRTA